MTREIKDDIFRHNNELNKKNYFHLKACNTTDIERDKKKNWQPLDKCHFFEILAAFGYRLIAGRGF